MKKATTIIINFLGVIITAFGFGLLSLTSPIVGAPLVGIGLLIITSNLIILNK